MRAAGELPLRISAGVAPEKTEESARMSLEERAVETANPLGRIGKPEEIVALIAFLAGPGAGFVTGQCLSADGGAAMH